MDALVDGLLEELNCDVVFKIPIFGGIPIYESVVVTWIIMAAGFLLCLFLGRKPLRPPDRRCTGSRIPLHLAKWLGHRVWMGQRRAPHPAALLHPGVRRSHGTA